MARKETKGSTKISWGIAVLILIVVGLAIGQSANTEVDSTADSSLNLPSQDEAGGCQEGDSLCAIADPKMADDLGGDEVFVYYLHRTGRCPTCNALQSLAKEAVETNFAEEISRGEVTFGSFNVDEPENRHFVARYGIIGPSLIVSKIKEGQEVEYTNLDRIWQLVRSPKDYSEYVTQEIQRLLKESD